MLVSFAQLYIDVKPLFGAWLALLVTATLWATLAFAHWRAEGWRITGAWTSFVFKLAQPTMNFLVVVGPNPTDRCECLAGSRSKGSCILVARHCKPSSSQPPFQASVLALVRWVSPRCSLLDIPPEWVLVSFSRHTLPAGFTTWSLALLATALVAFQLWVIFMQRPFTYIGADSFD